MTLGTPTIPYLMMSPQMLSKLIPSNCVKSHGLSTNSIPLTPTNTTIHGISGNVKASMQTIIGNSPILICPDMTDNVLSQGWLAQNKSIMTTFNSIDNIYRISFGSTAFHISMAKDFLYYLRRNKPNRYWHMSITFLNMAKETSRKYFLKNNFPDRMRWDVYVMHCYTPLTQH